MKYLQRFSIPFIIAVVGGVGIWGGNAVTSLLGSIWPNLDKWITENPKAYIIIWALAAWVSFLFKSNYDRGKELRDLRGYDHDLPLMEAIMLIQKNKRWKDTSDIYIQQAITHLAFENKLKVWGQPAADFHAGPLCGTLVEIPNHYFYDVLGTNREDGDYFIQRYADQPGLNEPTKYKCIFSVTVSSKQIRGIFSKLTPDDFGSFTIT